MKLLIIAIILCTQNSLEGKLYDRQKAKLQERQEMLRQHYLEDCQPQTDIADVDDEIDDEDSDDEADQYDNP